MQPYQAVPAEDDLEDSESKPRRVSPSDIHITRGWLLLDRVFKATTLALLTLLCVLLVVDVALWRRKQEPGRKGDEGAWSVRREYGSDARYMSLDHQYDGLWEEEMAPTNALIYLSPPAAEGRPEVGSITM